VLSALPVVPVGVPVVSSAGVVPARVVREATDADLLHIRGNAASYTDRLDAARQVRRV
jgi:hypothetical protein